MNELQDRELEEQLRTALGSPSAADFDTWRSRHGDAIAYLNPVVTATYHRRRRVFVRIVSGAAAAAVIAAAVTWFFVPQEPTFAQTIHAIKKAETISCTIDWYTRFYSKDGERSWLRREPRWVRAYLAPGRYRDTRYDKNGNVASVAIEDVASGTVLRLDMKKKEAMLKQEPSGQFGPGNPFDGFAKVLESKPIEFIGQRDIKGVKVNVFRRYVEFLQGGSETMDIWLDAESKQLVGYCTTPGDDPFDPATAPDRDNRPEPRFSKGTIAGVITSDIVFDAQLDPKLFSLTPPDGFKVVEPKPRPKITEELLVEWLRVTARANDGGFPDATRGLFGERHNALYEKPKTDRSEAEQEYLDLARKHQIDGNIVPISEFAKELTEPRSFRYLGKGVRLGSSDRIVCFYKLKSAGEYRAVYGDLTIKDVDPRDLPLPVEE